MTTLTVSEVLRCAADVLDQRGWCQGDYTDDQGRVCAAGAISVVVTGHPFEDYVCTGSDEAVSALADYLRYTRCGQGADWNADWNAGRVAEWNDAPNRTASEVKAALLAAADEASEP